MNRLYALLPDESPPGASAAVAARSQGVSAAATAIMMTFPYGRASWQALFPDNAAAPQLRTGASGPCGEGRHAHRHDDFASRSVYADGLVDVAALTAFFARHANYLLRSKGIVKTGDRWKVVQWTPESLHVSNYAGAPQPRSELVLIGPRLAVDRACRALTDIFL